jgi:hypothetical protein
MGGSLPTIKSWDLPKCEGIVVTNAFFILKRDISINSNLLIAL